MLLKRSRLPFLSFCLLFSIVALANTGCLAAVLGTAAVGGAAGYAYYQGNDYQDFQGDFRTTWRAAHLAMQDLKLPVNRQNTGEGYGRIESTTETGDRVYIYVEPMLTISTNLTRVHIRVGYFGDHELSEYFHQRIAFHLSQQLRGNAPPSIIDNPQFLPPPNRGPATNEPPLISR